MGFSHKNISSFILFFLNDQAWENFEILEKSNHVGKSDFLKIS